MSMFTGRTPHFQAQRTSNVTDLSLPDLGSIAPEASLYNGLRESERKLDWAMARKVLEIQDTISKPLSGRKRIRVYVSHAAHDQQWQLAAKNEDGSNSGPAGSAIDVETGRGIPSWELKIEGKPLEEESVSTPTASSSSSSVSLPPPPPRKFTSFLKSMIVEIDRDQRIYPEEPIVEWQRNPAMPTEDGFSIKRRGDLSIRVRIILHLDHVPDRCSVAHPLSTVLGIKQASRSDVVTALWNYIKINGLQDKNDRRTIRPDEKLRQVFPNDSIAFQNVAELVDRYLLPPEPVIIYHTIRVDPQEPTKTVAYDIEVDMDDVVLKSKMKDVLTRLTPHVDSQVSRLDEEIRDAAQAIRDAKLKQHFFTSFSDNPQEFIKTWMASQSRDLETILGTDRGVPEELMHRSDFFRLPWVEEAVAVHEGMRLAGALPYQAATR